MPLTPTVKLPLCDLAMRTSATGLIVVLSVALLLPPPVRVGSFGSVTPEAGVTTVAVLLRVPVAVVANVPETV